MKLNLLFIAVISLSMSGCALFTNFSRYAKVPVDASQKDVEVTVFRDGEPYEEFTTPHIVELKASENLFFPADYEFLFQKKGYISQTEYRRGHISYGYWGNFGLILVGGLGLVGFVTDPLCDQLYSIEDEPINVNLERGGKGKPALKMAK